MEEEKSLNFLKCQKKGEPLKQSQQKQSIKMKEEILQFSNNSKPENGLQLKNSELQNKETNDEDTGASVEVAEIEVVSSNSDGVEEEHNPLSKAIKKLKGKCRNLKKISRNYRRGTNKKYPGVTFLKPRLKVDEISLKNSKAIELNTLNKKKENPSKKRSSRGTGTKREGERIFRVDLQKAFNLDKVEIISPEKLPVKYCSDSLKKPSTFSTFPLNFTNLTQPGKSLKERIIECSDAFHDEDILLAKNEISKKRLRFVKAEKKIQKRRRKFRRTLKRINRAKYMKILFLH